MIEAKRDIRETLVQRVERQVAGKGISRRTVEAAVARVVDALDTTGVAKPPTVVAALTARSTPDLASRVRQALRAEGVADLEVGIATAGQHTVVTVRVPDAARGALERAAAKIGASLSILPDAGRA